MTPVPEASGTHGYEVAFNGCGERADREIPPGDMRGALTRPGNFYKVLRGYDAILIVVPRAKLAGYFAIG